MKIKRWLFLPFLGGGSEEEPVHSGPNGRNSGQDAGVLSKHESKANFANKGEEEIVQDYNAPIRWWVVATLFPLIAGTFGPMASMFNVCAVAIDWRIIVSLDSNESEGQHITDPRWLVAVNAVSLAIAIIANLALLAHMTERVRFNIAIPITIVGWYISGFLDIALVASARVHVPLPDNNELATYSQAYYYAIFSGTIYVILSMMLSMTACGVWILHYSSEFKLSLAQRSLMLQTILFLSYVLCAAAVYSRVESWSYLDCVYYVVVTLFTIGFGDLTPETHLGRSLYFPFAVGGIIFVGLIIANIRTLVIESVSVKVSTRMVEKARYKALKSGDPANGIVKIRGLKRCDTNAPTELERREKEFTAMRYIQRTAAHNNRMFALLLSATAFMILWFVGAVAFWQAEQAIGGQHWSYFESLYFTYTAQLTIGYGDFEPQTNSSKPAFVFWSLIALPTLTVLIGAIGDAVTDFVDSATLWLAKQTPSILNLLSRLNGNRNKGEVAEDAMEKAGGDAADASDGFGNIGSLENGRFVPADKSLNAFGNIKLETLKHAYRPFIMLQVAHLVTSHLDQSTPRKYSFDEWTFLLMLLGEDEATEEGHRKIGQVVPDDAEVVTPVRHKKQEMWSWMGQESPLMNLDDGSEPKWVLQRLMEVLETELRTRGDAHVVSEINKLVPPRRPSNQ